MKAKNNFEGHGRSKSRMEYRPINKSTTKVSLENVFDTLNAITMPSTDSHNNSHVVSDDDESIKGLLVNTQLLRIFLVVLRRQVCLSRKPLFYLLQWLSFLLLKFILWLFPL